MSHSLYHLLCVTILCFAAIGCSQPPARDASVSGTVLVAGELAEGGTVTFHPVEEGPLAVGRIMPDGSFTVRTGQGDLSDVDRGTLKSGDYKVTILVYAESGEKVAQGGPPKAGPRLTAAKYASVNTTDLERTVKPGDNLFVFEIEGASADESSTADNADATTESGTAEPETLDDQANVESETAEPPTAEDAPAEEAPTEPASDSTAETVDAQADTTAEQPAEVASEPESPEASADDAAEEPQQ